MKPFLPSNSPLALLCHFDNLDQEQKRRTIRDNGLAERATVLLKTKTATSPETEAVEAKAVIEEARSSDGHRRRHASDSSKQPMEKTVRKSHHSVVDTTYDQDCGGGTQQQ